MRLENVVTPSDAHASDSRRSISASVFGSRFWRNSSHSMTFISWLPTHPISAGSSPISSACIDSRIDSEYPGKKSFSVFSAAELMKPRLPGATTIGLFGENRSSVFLFVSRRVSPHRSSKAGFCGFDCMSTMSHCPGFIVDRAFVMDSRSTRWVFSRSGAAWG